MIYCPQDAFTNGLGSDTVVELCPSGENPAAYFTQLILNGNLVIPPQKPPKTHIVNVSKSIVLKDVQVIPVTPPDADEPVGNKILVSGTVTLGIQYIADVPSQKVHFFQVEVPFNTIIYTDCGEPIPTDDPIFENGFVIHVCVEKMRFTQIDSRTIAKEIVLMVWAQAI